METQFEIPNKNDVLFGRGAIINKHPGNQRYRSSVEAQKPAYRTAERRKDKRAIAVNVMQQVYNCTPPGRFLVEDDTSTCTSPTPYNYTPVNNFSSNIDEDDIHPEILSKNWVKVSDDKAMVKIMHIFREKHRKSTNRGGSENSLNTNGDTSIDNLEQRNDAVESNNHLGADETNAPLQQILSIGVDDNSVGQFDDLFDDLGESDAAGQFDNLLANIGLQEFKEGETGEDLLQPDFSREGDENEEGVGQFDDLFDNADDNADTFVERNAVSDHELNSFLRNVSIGNNSDVARREQQQLHELSMYQWVALSSSRLLKRNSAQVTQGELLEYSKEALSIAFKLTDLLIDAEKEERYGRGNPIPLKSIVPEHVFIRARRWEQEIVVNVWIMSSMGEDSATGTVKERLYAVGIVLYALFAGDVSTLSFENSCMLFHDECIDPSKEDENDNEQQGRRSSRRVSTQSSLDGSSNCIARLESKGFPHSIRALVINLLECGKDDYSFGDDTYSSFLDLKQDLSLMLADPTRFLEDIQVSNGLPSLEICDKLYGREEEEAKLDKLYQVNEFKGVIISGRAGVGKSRLTMHIQNLTTKANGYFFMAKFQQNHLTVKPLATIGSLFNSLCDSFWEDASPNQLKSVSDALANALGSQAGLLAGVVPSLSKLIPSYIQLEETSSTCIDAPSSMRYLFGELLCVISSHSRRPISLFMDDLQFADSSSLLLIGHLLFSAAKSDSSIFFAFCHRDDEASMSGTFEIWLSSISMYSLEGIKLDNMSAEGVNSLVSDALHLSPRITRPLSAVLHHKTMGNPLFVRQLLVSLTGQGYIYVDLSQPRWTWDLKKIADQEISESVLALLMQEMKRMPTDLQLGLKVASCLGSSVETYVLEILSKYIGVNLYDILRQVSERGYMDKVDDGTVFSFAHDNIQQAAYELVPEQERRKNHMQYGMALCCYTLDNCPDNNDLFFTAITQINQGGPSIIDNTRQKISIASLNLKAGKLSIILSDYTAALSLFEHGISYLGDDKWTAEYELTLNLFDAATEAACVLNKNAAVASYSEQLVAHSKSFDDSLNCRTVAAKCLCQVQHWKESMTASFDTLSKLGEKPLQDMSNATLKADMLSMNEILRSMPDDSILNMQAQKKNKKLIATFKLYANLAHVLHAIKPSLLCAVSLRMIEITVKNGLGPSSPLSFVHYGGVLVAAGNVHEGCRLGRLALKLVERKESLVLKSRVIAMTYFAILWTAEPLHSIVDEHMLGRKLGLQTGDFLYTSLNWGMSINTSYFAGVSLDSVQKKFRDYIVTMRSQNGRVLIAYAYLYYHQTVALIDGICALDKTPPNNIPTVTETLEQCGSDILLISQHKIHHLVRTYLFRRLDDVSLDSVGILDDMKENKHVIRPIFLLGLFFEGLTSYLLARQTKDNERTRWIEKGENVLMKMKYWSEQSSWNWKSKVVLLEAEKMHTLGNFDQASLLYKRAICVAHQHKFINDEAIASDLAGVFFYERGQSVAAEAILLHSVQSYKTWGALAVAKRVETFIATVCGPIHSSVSDRINILRSILLVSNEDSSSKKKRQER